MIRAKTTDYVDALAKRRNPTVKANHIDHYAANATELAGDEVAQDHTLDIIVALKRAGIISKTKVSP